MVFDRLFSRGKRKNEDPDLRFGRYSDNNKSVEKVNSWNDSEAFFKQKKYRESIDALFDYLRDDEEQNVILEMDKNEGHFQIYQGSKMVRGRFDNAGLSAEITLARMAEPSIPVMRRLLEMNFNLYYSRYALQNDRLCMRFDSDLASASPNKLYYGLKELATKADKQDDLLLREFSSLLQPLDTEHIMPVPAEEKRVKYEFLQNSIRSALDNISTLDAEKFSGGISYLLLSLVFSIDYLIAPEGKILQDLEKIATGYYGKDEKASVEKNSSMMEELSRLLKKSKEEVFSDLFRAKHSFAIVAPHNHRAISEAIENAAENMGWYRDNNYQWIANKVLEYGFAYSQYSFSLPEPLSELFKLFMQVNYSAYFTALGFRTRYYDEKTNYFDEEAIIDRIQEIVNTCRNKYSSLEFKTKKIRFDGLLNFNHSFTMEIAQLNFE